MKNKIILLALLGLPMQAPAIEWQGTVVGVHDGDTLTVLNADNKEIKIRLTEIDAPELRQAYGNESKKSLSDMCFGKTIIVDDEGGDRYKRTLGRVKCDGVDANAQQVKRGMAWAYRKYLSDLSIAEFEDEARASKVGLWGGARRIPPWKFRHKRHRSNKV